MKKNKRNWSINLLVSFLITLGTVLLSDVGVLKYEFSNLDMVFLNFLIWIILNQEVSEYK